MKDDVINRQQAIEDAKTWVAVDDHERRLKKDVIEWLKEFPPAQQKTGKWIYDGDCYKCNKCGTVYGWWADSQTSNFCPNCGVRMKEVQDGNQS